MSMTSLYHPTYEELLELARDYNEPDGIMLIEHLAAMMDEYFGRFESIKNTREIKSVLRKFTNNLIKQLGQHAAEPCSPRFQYLAQIDERVRALKEEISDIRNAWVDFEDQCHFEFDKLTKLVISHMKVRKFYDECMYINGLSWTIDTPNGAIKHDLKTKGYSEIEDDKIILGNAKYVESYIKHINATN